MTRKLMWLALGLALVLLLTVTAMARLPSNQTSSGGVYIQYDNIFDNIDPAHGFPVTGGHKRWGWKDLEPTQGGYQFESEVRVFVQQQASRGKKAALGLETFVGRINQTAPNGSLAVPAWLWTSYPSVRLWNTVDNSWYVLNYLDSNYKARYQAFVNALADWLNANTDVAANVGWVELGVGLYGETQPSDQWVTKNAPDYNYYANFATGGSSPPGWSATDWDGYVRWCVDTYVNAFRVRNTRLGHIALFLNCAPEFKGTRGSFTDYAAVKGVGLKNNGLQVDRHPYYLYQPLEKWWGASGFTVTVPVAWETYEQWLTNETELYWGLLCAMDKHPDVLEPDRWLMVDHSYQARANYVAIWQWVEPYVGVTVDTTPGVWCALRETEYPSNGEPGNFSFFLFQGDSYGTSGTTVAAFNQTGLKEGRYTRRTDQATGNPFMWFRIADTYVNGNASRDVFTVYVTYLDRGSDTWQLGYDSFTGSKSAGTIVKTNTNTWKKATFVLTDARFGNNIGTSSDLKLDCNSDGDDYFHLVEIKRGSGGPTPTPTNPPSGATIQGNVQLQGRPAAPHAQWVTPLTVTVGSTPYAVTTDQSGSFTVSGLTAGVYNIRVKNRHTLANIKNSVTLVAGTNTVNMGTLKEGDADNNNIVNIADFGILKAMFNPLYDGSADFNNDSVVNIADFGLLKTNFGASGDVILSGMTSLSDRGEALSEESVALSLVPASSVVPKDNIVAVQIQLAAGSQQVDGVEVHLDFDPADLQVVNAQGNPASSIEAGNRLDVPIQNVVDNATGQVNFAAGTFSAVPPNGTFVLATVRLRARWSTGHHSTNVTFSTELPRKTDVRYSIGSVMGSVQGCTISSGEGYRIYLPVAW